MKKTLIILNPMSGQKKGKKHLADILELFCNADFECTVKYTLKKFDARDIAAENCNKYELIVVVGGDGTLNEVIEGILSQSSKTPIGYIPAGSTNDFANSLKLPKNLLRATQRIIDGEELELDVGCFNGRYFSYVASFGAFTKASYSTPQDFKNTLGHLAYILEGIKELANIRKEHLQFRIGEEIFEDDYIFGAISNSTSIAGVLKLDEKVVDMNDGLFEIMLIKAPRNLIELNDCIAALTTKKYNCKMITFKSASKLSVFSSPSMDWTLDGEHQSGNKEINIENIHSAIKLRF